MVEYSENVAIAFVVVILAGLSTAVGASVVFFPSLIQYANRKTLASGLGLSAGVMTYVSFVEIFNKSVDSFVGADFLDHEAYFSATLCFFAGIILMICLNLGIHGVVSGNLITKGQYGPSDEDSDSDDDDDSDSNDSDFDEEFQDDDDLEAGSMKGDKSKKDHHGNQHYHHEATTKLPEPCNCTSEDPVGKLEEIHDMAKSIEMRTLREQQEAGKDSDQDNKTATLDLTDSDLEAGVNNSSNNNHNKPTNKKNNKKDVNTDNKSLGDDSTTSVSGKNKKKKSKEPSAKDKHRLRMMSLNTAVAIALHNFPEGLATFVATLQDPAVGVILAVAIAIHNIPEGLCVAMPVYYATGDRWRAFTWGLVSGVSEPLAALLGWIVLASWINDIVYAILFGVVAGMMVVISIKELIPTAHRYDPQDTCVSTMFIVGMAIMAASLVLFSHL